jgi:O-succinylbenzoic acid--CoA ligase
MEEDLLMSPGFWNDDAPVLLGAVGEVPRGIPGLLYFRTSGSSGEPKWIGLERRALQASAAAVNRHLAVDPASVWGLALPLAHVGGFGVVARARQAACALARFDGKWNAPEFARWLATARVSHLSLVPTQVHDLVRAGLRAPEPLRAVVVGGGCLAPDAGRAARGLGWPVLASYGMTEAASQVATQGLERLDSPYLPEPLDLLPCWDARHGADGRIEIRGESLFRGTLRREESGWRFEKREGEWFPTSDRGTVEGRELRVAGRVDGLVKILGELVDPLAVRAEILAAAAGSIEQSGIVVVAVDDVRAGKRLVLVHDRSAPQRLIDAAVGGYHARCPGFQRITATVAVDEIPRGPLGKPLAVELSRIAAGAVN